MDPRNPDFERAVRESFSKQRIMGTLGASLERVGAGEAEIRLPSRAEGHMRADGDEVLVAAMQATIMAIEGRAEVTG